jgi:hypothetical protein
MAQVFIREEGTGDPNANTYSTIGHADAYLENSGRKAGAWADAGTSGKQSAMVQAWFYMIGRWRGKWIGQPTNRLQAGDWPQRGQFYPSHHAVASNEIPEDIEHAQIEYAYAMVAEAASELAPPPTYDDSGRTITQKSEKVDVLSESTSFSEKGGSGRNVDGYRAYPIADGLLSNYVTGGSVHTLLRA